MQEINRNSVIVAGPQGGALDLISEDGEILAVFPVEPGRSKGTRWLDLVGPNQELQAGDGIIVLEPSHRIRLLTFGEEAFTSAANPHFQVTNAMRQSRELDRRLRRLEVAQSRVNAREAVLDRVEASRGGLPQEEPGGPVVSDPTGDPLPSSGLPDPSPTE